MHNIDRISEAHPSASVYADSIAHHSVLAPYYQYRAPYLPAFFAKIAQKLGLSAASVLLDICCGRGELAVGYAPHVGRIHAIDGSPAMLAHAMQRDNIRYAQHEVNADLYPAPEAIDHFVIGSAIHWIKAESLAGLIRANLKPGGRVVISHPLFALHEQPYKPALDAVLASYGKVVSEVDLYGVETLGKAGYAVCDTLRLTRKVSFDLKYLCLNQLSLAYGDFYRNISTHLAAFEKDLGNALQAFTRAGKLEATLVNWAYLYGPAGKEQTAKAKPASPGHALQNAKD